MTADGQLSLLRDLGTFWYSDSSVPQLFERKVIDAFIERSKADLPKEQKLEEIVLNIETILGSSITVKKESETCSKIIEPLLGLLGFKTKVGGQDRWLFDEQRNLTEDDLVFIPDYCLFPNKESHEAANAHEGNSYFSQVNLILEAKRLGKDLLSKSKIDRSLDDRENDPTSSLSSLSQIRRYVRASGAEFGIVTNGNDWILVSKTSRNYLSTYHIRLFELLELAKATDDYSLILYWWLPFSKFFLLDDDSSRAKFVRDETEHFTTGLEENLKKRLVPVVVELLNSISESGAKVSQNSRKEHLIIDVVRFLYLILYVGCIEDRNLLPINNPVYRYRYSLKELFRLISDNNNWNKKNSSTFIIFNQLERLMSMVSSGCKGLDKSGTISGLGDLHPQFKIPKCMRLDDQILRNVLLKILELEPDSGQMVSLRALDTIQFGNIYEHILRLEISFDRSKKFYIKNEGDKKFERTTAVYTPHHIVESMVSDVVASLDLSSWQKLESLKMVDPCFGSGHFLVEFARQVSQAVVDRLHPEDVEIDNFINHSVAERRLLVQRYLLTTCIYGVDRGHACADVARFSIWLSTAITNYPPVFLDFQLGTGSSLYGMLDETQVDKKDLSLLKEISKRRILTRKAFLAYGDKPKFLHYLKQNLKVIETKSKNLSKRFELLQIGYQVPNDEKESIKSRQNPFFWMKEFPEVFLNGGFDVYITNPPYDQLKASPSTMDFVVGESEIFRLGKMTDLDIKDYTHLFEKDPAYSPFQDGYKNLFEGFVLLKNKILKENGTYSLIIPNSILAGQQTSLVRKNLWSEKLLKVKEYPEKDAITKRVFRARKVACAILFGQRSKRTEQDSVAIEIYPNANVPTPELTGRITYASATVLDRNNMPLVLLDEWQKELVSNLEKFVTQTLNESSVKEGELNEKFSEESVSDTKTNGMVSIYGTNRMEFFYFNFFPKQDLVQYCKVEDASITSAKRKDYAKPRIAINGIAGTNDSRVLCASYLPSETLINSNVNYILTSDLDSKNVNPYFYIALMNSIAFDKIIRIQKRTNHNSSAMIASLPIIGSKNEDAMPDTILKKKSWANGELISTTPDGKKAFSSEFALWLSEISKLMLETGIVKNEKIYEVYSSLSAVSDLNQDQLNALARKIGNADLIVEEFILQNRIRGQQAKSLKEDISAGLASIKKILKIESQLNYFLNYYLSFGILGDIQKVAKFIEHYKLETFEDSSSLSELHDQLNKIERTAVQEYKPWKQAIGAA